MKRLILSALALGFLAACDPVVPDSGSGVGFGNYQDYQRQQQARDAALQGSALPPPQAVSTETLGSTTPSATPLRAAGTSAPAPTPAQATQTAAAAPAPAQQQGGFVQASPSNPAPVLRSGGISDENNFGAVSAQRSIESDAALQAQNRAQYQVIQPTALPTRQGGSAPNIVAYALQTKNARGQRVYRRNTFNAQRKYQRNCAVYPSPDRAQEAFLAAGGPRSDRKGLDPDGDGFACSWDPAPFRRGLASN